jgi:hypothetical protein
MIQIEIQPMQSATSAQVIQVQFGPSLGWVGRGGGLVGGGGGLNFCKVNNLVNCARFACFVILIPFFETCTEKLGI